MKILLVDDHVMVRQAISALLERGAADAVVLQAGDLEEAFALAAAHDDVDAVFLDLNLPRTLGVSALHAFAQRFPALPVIVLSANDNPDMVRQAFAAGALGYVPKSASADTLLAALGLVLKGEVFVPSLVVRPAGASPGASAVSLTNRQTEVLSHLGRGLSNKSIAKRMGLSEKTVKAHVTAVYRSLSVETRREAIAAAQGAGLI